MSKQQLELSLESAATSPRLPRRHRRLARARWWFGQMRQVVDRAWDGESPAGTPNDPSCLKLSRAPVGN